MSYHPDQYVTHDHYGVVRVISSEQGVLRLRRLDELAWAVIAGETEVQPADRFYLESGAVRDRDLDSRIIGRYTPADERETRDYYAGLSRAWDGECRWQATKPGA